MGDAASSNREATEYAHFSDEKSPFQHLAIMSDRELFVVSFVKSDPFGTAI